MGYTYADNALLPDQLNELVIMRTLSIALAVRLEVAQVANVALVILWGAVVLVVRVDYA